MPPDSNEVSVRMTNAHPHQDAGGLRQAVSTHFKV